MRINSDLVNSINENYIELGNTWLWSDKDVYSFDYLEILSQPISLDCITLDFLRFKDDEVTLTIRSGVTSATPLVYLATTQTLPDSNQNSVHNTLQGLQGGLSGNFYHISEPIFSYTSGISASVQTQINTTNFNLQTSSTSLQIQIDTLAQQSVSGMGAGTINRVGKFVTSGSLGDSTISDNGSLVQITNNVSASGNVSGNSFVKIGGTSTQFLKADGSSDSNVYTTTASTSAISANLQTQITNNNNKLSAYLPLSGGTLTGQLNAKYISGDSGAILGANIQELLRLYRPVSGVGFTWGQTFEANNNVGERVIYTRIRANIDGAVSGLHSGSFIFSVYKNGVETTAATLTNDQLKVFGTISASENIYGNSFVKFGGTSAQFLKANGSIDSNVYITSSSLTPYTLLTTTSAISANLQSQINNNKNSLSGYLPLSGGTLTGQLKGTTISASGNVSGVNFVGNLTGYKNVDNGNECTISNGFASTQSLYINYRGATSAIKQYNFCNGLGTGVYSGILASAFIKNGGTSAQFLKADGSVDSSIYITSSSLTPYTLTTTTSAISANLQSQINLKADKTSLSAYLPLSGGTLSGQLLIKSQLSASGDLIGSRHIIPGGLPTQFLKADGSVDSNSYALDTLGAYYLPLSGGTLTGDLVTSGVRPMAPNSYDLGSVFFPYLSLYVSAINANKINMEGSIIPINSLLYDLGSNSNKWRTVYTKDINSVAMSTVFDRAVEAVDVKSHVLIGFDNQLAPHLNFSNSLGTSATLSGDCFFDSTRLKIRDKNLVLNTFAYTSDLSAYTPTSGFNRTISAYLPLSGGTLTGQLKAPSVSASGNISAVNFVGTLNGSKLVQFGNETSIANNYAGTGSLWINYRGVTSAITEYLMGSGNSDGQYARVRASGFIKNGGLGSQYLMADGSVSYSDAISDKFLPLSGGTMTGNLIIKEAFIGTSSLTDNAYFSHKLYTNVPAIRQSFQGYTTIDSTNDLGNDLGLDLCINNDPKISIRNAQTTIYNNLNATNAGLTNLTATNITSTGVSATNLQTVQLQSSKGAGFNGSTTYLESAPIIYTSASTAVKTDQLLQIMNDYGLIQLI